MGRGERYVPIVYALLAALFYAVNTPFSKVLLREMPPAFLAALLYLGAGVGIGILYLFHGRKDRSVEKIGKSDLPYTVGMIVLDILAPVFLMIGIQNGTASSAALLGNFEIVATTLIAFLVFKEPVGKKLVTAIVLILVSSILLTFEGRESFRLYPGSIFVLLATVCWGLENNCTRKISGRSTYEIVMLKGFFSGGGILVISRLLGEEVPPARYILPAMVLGFVAYGLSIFTYIRAQRSLGAAKTSAYYAVAPFIGAFLSFVLLPGERLTVQYLTALLFMIVGTVFVVMDTLERHHAHMHTHLIVHTHDGTTHEHVIVHSHEHSHYAQGENHEHHHHTPGELEEALKSLHS